MRAASLLVLGVLAFATEAKAQSLLPEGDGLDGHGFAPAPIDGDVRDPLVVHRVGGWSPQQGFVTGLFEYADAPLVWCARSFNESGCLDEQALLDNVLALNLSGGYAITERIRFFGGAPLYLSTASDHSPGGGGIGDVRLGGQLAAFRNGPVQLGLVPWLDLPSGDADRYLGEAGVGGGVAAAGSVEAGPVTVSADVGTQATSTNRFEPDTANRLLVGMGLGISPTDDWGITVESRVTPRFLADPIPGTGAPSELFYTFRKKLDRGLHVQLGGSNALTAGPRAARYRLFFGLGWTQSSTYDIDGDGIVHELDVCPYEPETFNAWQDADGCPEDPVFFDVETYIDGALVKGAELTMQGAVPNITPGSFVGTPGRPIAVQARYGGCLLGTAETEVAPHMDPVPVHLKVEHGTLRIAVKTDAGAPVPNASISWVPKDVDPRCSPGGSARLGAHGRLTTVVGAAPQTFVVTAPGLGSRVKTVMVAPRDATSVDVVLEAPRVTVRRDFVQLGEVLWFNYNSATLHAESTPLVEEVAAVLLAHPELEKVQVVGHTDDQGTPEFNQILSEQRAEAVRARLIGLGVDPERLEAVGRGATQPVASNRTRRGRAENRRVELSVVHRGS